MKIMVVGLGNPILGDDGVGWKVAENLIRWLSSPDALDWQKENCVDVECLSIGGLALMEHLIGYDSAILIDSFKSDGYKGSVLVMRLEDMPDYSAFHTASAHDTSLQSALVVGEKLGAQLPKQIMVVGITTEVEFEFGSDLTPEVQGAVPIALQAVLDLLGAPAERNLERSHEGDSRYSKG